MSYYRASGEFTGYANSFQAIARLGLDSIATLLKHLGNPHDKLRFIHVAGTNGKGSVCVFLRTMLTREGYKTGIYTSPNMLCVNERISIDGCDISDIDMKRILEQVEAACRKTETEIGLYPTQFEIWTAMAMCYFCENKCDYVVLETGLGGRLDATNVVATTVLSVITHIALDHTQYLGDTLAKVAGEKAGIIKPDTMVVSSQQDSEALQVIADTCRKIKCKLTIAEKLPLGRHDGIYELISGGEFDGVRLLLGGINQLDNASCAIAAARLLGISHESICYGLANASHMGRFEMVCENTCFDGAHNPDGVTALKNNIDRYFGGREKIYIMATMEDKDIGASLEILKDSTSQFMMVEVCDNARSMSADELASKACALGLDAIPYDSIGEAYAAARMSGKLIIICGSLYLYKDFTQAVNIN